VPKRQFLVRHDWQKREIQVMESGSRVENVEGNDRRPKANGERERRSRSRRAASQRKRPHRLLRTIEFSHHTANGTARRRPHADETAITAIARKRVLDTYEAYTVAPLESDD
jgi:hypothetical protein